MKFHRFPTGGDSYKYVRKVRELHKQLIRCNSETDSIVWMREENMLKKRIHDCKSRKLLS